MSEIDKPEHAHTFSSDPALKHLKQRRDLDYLEQSIERGLQWVAFEPNGEQLWANVRRTIEDFLLNQWQLGALLGNKPEQAYFVRCDRTTMTQEDIDNGRLVCLVGVALIRPAEFVIIRIGLWTADHQGDADQQPTHHNRERANNDDGHD